MYLLENRSKNIFEYYYFYFLFSFQMLCCHYYYYYCVFRRKFFSSIVHYMLLKYFFFIFSSIFLLAVYKYGRKLFMKCFRVYSNHAIKYKNWCCLLLDFSFTCTAHTSLRQKKSMQSKNDLLLSQGQSLTIDTEWTESKKDRNDKTDMILFSCVE